MTPEPEPLIVVLTHVTPHEVRVYHITTDSETVPEQEQTDGTDSRD